MQFQLIYIVFLNLIVISTSFGYCSCGYFEKKATDTIKSIYSPKYPYGYYCDDLDCTYRLEADDGYRILVNLTDLSTEECCDHLLFYDGDSTDATLIKNFSGTSVAVWPLIESSDNHLTVRFVTDEDSHYYKGFMLQFMAELKEEQKNNNTESAENCACELQKYNSNETSGEIKSPNYPDFVCYTATYCVYEIASNPDFELNVVLTLQIKSSYKLTIYQTIQYEGREIQMEIQSYTATESKSNQFNFPKNVGVRIILEYDSTVSEKKNCGWGCKKATKTAFTAVFNRIKKDLPCPYPVVIASNEPKTMLLSFKEGLFHTITECSLIFIAEKRRKIKMHFHKGYYCRANFVQLENNTEIREIENNEDYDDYESEIISLQSETSEMTLKVTKQRGPCDFDITYMASDADCKCGGGKFTDNSSTVTHLSPGFPYSFCPGLECYNEFTNNLTVEKTSGNVKAFLLTWNDFQRMNTVTELRLLVRMDEGAYLPVLFASYGDTHILMGSKLTISFKSINTLGTHGYNVTVEAIIIPKKCLCSNTPIKILPRDEGSLELLLPGDCQLIYCHYNTETSFYIRNEFVFSWLNFQLASEGDKLTLKEEGGEDRSFYYNSGREDQKFFSQKNLVLSFERDDRTNGINRTKMDSKVEIKWKSGTKCSCFLPDDMATNEVKSIYSPNYPQPYCNNMNCIHNIRAEEGYHIMVNITEFDTENFNDFLKFYDGNNTEKRLLKKKLVF